MTSNEIRQQFLSFFESKQHIIVASAPIVVKNDPTLLFINSGMAPFKGIFLGQEKAKFARIADSQKCLRVSGKHNDLEEVGIDTYHHTFFEMLGNWSFGDYFKEEAIAWAWELLTEIYKIDKDRLYVTVFEGYENDGLDADNETLEIWKKLIDESHILYGSKKDNFWEMGDSGPCGPCSEIHVDLRSDDERKLVDAKTLVNADHPQVVEIWNNVFMQYNRLASGKLEELPARHVDTGMGFERLCMALQGKISNYDTDVFQPLIQFLATLSGFPYPELAEERKGEKNNQAIAMRVIADHIRAVAFTIADGQLPSNTGAGYVIRRILRRAVRYGYTFLNLNEAFMYKLLPILSQQFKNIFPDLLAQQEFVQKVIMEEENAFLRTLSGGIHRFEKYKPAENSTIISGEFAFELYDTFGFPYDLTDLMAREKGWEVDLAEFTNCLNEQKKRSRNATSLETEDWVVLKESDAVFVGYDIQKTDATVLKYRKVNAKGQIFYQLVLDQTPFYAESGGQVGDTGYLISVNEKIEIFDTKKENNVIVHLTKTLPENANTRFSAEINTIKRQLIANNHSATHLLHAALKEVVGKHVNQKGSLVNDEYLRFDFSHFAKLTPIELTRIENLVNEKIFQNIPLKEERNVPYDQAINSGVTALFGEKYGDFVRVITFDDEYSKELCGGTHTKSTGTIGIFKIIAESAVAAGVRRIEALTSRVAIEFYEKQVAELDLLKLNFSNPSDLNKQIQQLLDENSAFKKEQENVLKNKISQLADDLLLKVKSVNGINLLAIELDLPNTDAAKQLAYLLKSKVENLVLTIAIVSDQKPSLTVLIADNLVEEKKLNAGKIIRELAVFINGGGGGQPNFATAGGKNKDGIAEALAKIKKIVEQA